MGHEKDLRKFETLHDLDVHLLYVEGCLKDLYDQVFGLQSEAVGLLNRSLKEFGYKITKI